MSSIRYWTWLSALPGIRSVSLRELLEHYGSPTELYFTPSEEYERLSFLNERERASLSDKALRNADAIMETCERQGIRIMTRQDADYPSLLSQIYDPPAVLYLRGRLPFVDESPAVAIVGTRRCSVYGEKMALRIGYQLVKGGGIVVSGLALGIDGAGAKGALMAGGRVVGVLGTAIDVAYPSANASLIEDVASVGCVISEYPPGSRIANFPRRNRILSGLANGVCVVEAPVKSGALITANDALEQGRDLFVVPGNADNPSCAGSNALLRDCARMVTGGADILEEYRGRFAVRPNEARPYPLTHSDAVPEEERIAEAEAEAEESAPHPTVEEKSEADGIDKSAPIQYIDLETRLKDCSEAQIVLARILQKGERHADELIEESGFSAAKTMAELTLLCIRGIAAAKPGKRYILKE